MIGLRSYFSKSRFYHLLSLLIIAIIGLFQLPIPFFGDQAFYLLGAKEMDAGYILYRDFWDIKQPGIFFFYWIGGKLFGFNPIGIHIFELIYWLFFSAVLIWFLQKSIFKNNPVWACISAIALVGTYYACAYPATFTQVEMLVNFPLMLVFIFNTKFLNSPTQKGRWLFLSGMAGGIVILFKLILAPIIAVFWIITLVSSSKKIGFSTTLLIYVWVAAGVIFVWLPFLTYAWYQGILKLCFNTFINYPPQIIKHCTAMPIDHLLFSITNFSKKIILVIPLMILSIKYLKNNTFIQTLFIWFIVALAVILLQRTSWYSWHFHLLYPPIILMAIFSLKQIFEGKLMLNKFFSKFKPKWVVLSLLVLINSSAIVSCFVKLYRLYPYNFGLTSSDRLEYAFTNEDNARAFRISKIIENEKDSFSPIYVVDDPLVYYYTQRNQSTAQSGWNLHLFIPGQMQILIKELSLKPPAFIFIRETFDYYFDNTGSPIMSWIKSNYIVLNTNEDGTWYKKTKI